ncbi:Long-chain-fatty-acid--CoA ligase [Methylobacterium crusticola]|uniref:Long-chain-fatty-acid--CoA ligase n=1 Tax=Methylobacterium crusticola TaxID=1697972 RepID=A0ABQ4R178_9HYPH|nr:AMP-binding protein [Methylobacterium crusticola]GJD51428.1 Long-chain-fatty-acid--CoA ligase [Methylobacterium crusticola]
MNLSDLIDRNAAFDPGKPALRFEGLALSYAEFSARIAAAAGALARLGVGRGDRVAVLALNDPELLVLLYACARRGAMLLPLNWRLAVAEQAYILADAGARALLVQEAFGAVLPEVRARLPGTAVLGLDHAPEAGAAWADLRDGAGAGGDGLLRDPVLLVYTSGTTGRPKGAVLTQEALVWNGLMSQHMHGLTAADHVLAVLPFFHVGGLNIQATPALHLGATVTVHPRFAPAATLAALAQDRPSLTLLVPATLQALIAEPGFGAADLSSLRALSTGSTYVPQDLVDALEARGVPVLQVYGATETGPVSVYTRLGGDRSRPGSTGLPGLACACRVVDEAGREAAPGASGEIWLRGPHLFSGYWRNAAATAEALRDGWFLTGDVGRRDPDGYLTVHDRKKNLIISGGENISAAEVERVLLGHPAVAEAAVIGRPDPRWGEVPVARVVLHPGAACAPDELVAHVLGQLARFKAPREVRFVASLPRNALGKVQHHLVRAADEAGREA